MASLGFDVACWGRGDRVIADISGFSPPAAPIEVFGGDWMAEMRRVLGLHERHDKAEVSAWLKSDGPTLGDPSKLPWCGDAVDTALRLAGVKTDLENPYLARNWLKFGERTEPRFGAVMVFWRGRRAGHSGHVAFYVSEDATHYHVIGGNQGNRISVVRISKDRFLGARWPIGAPEPAHYSIAPGSTTVNEA